MWTSQVRVPLFCYLSKTRDFHFVMSLAVAKHALNLLNRYTHFNANLFNLLLETPKLARMSMSAPA